MQGGQHERGHTLYMNWEEKGIGGGGHQRRKEEEVQQDERWIGFRERKKQLSFSIPVST